jgi:hypothetical protein
MRTCNKLFSTSAIHVDTLSSTLLSVNVCNKCSFMNSIQMRLHVIAATENPVADGALGLTSMQIFV